MPHAAAAEDPSLKTRPAVASATVQMAAALDHHAILAAILADRAAAISKTPSREGVILVAHGPNEDKENAMWLADLSMVAKLIVAQKSFARVEATTVRDEPMSQCETPPRRSSAAW